MENNELNHFHEDDFISSSEYNNLDKNKNKIKTEKDFKKSIKQFFRKDNFYNPFHQQTKNLDENKDQDPLVEDVTSFSEPTRSNNFGVTKQFEQKSQTTNLNLQRKLKQQKERTYKFLNKSDQGKFVNKFTVTKRLALIIPFVLITIIFLIIPLIIILVYAFSNIHGTNGFQDNWGIITGTIGQKIGMSILVALVTTLFCLIIAYPFTYFLAISKNKTIKIIVIILITAPVWLNLLIKLIGLKTLFDIMGHGINSTYGNIFTIIGLTYIYLPYLIMPLYTSLESLPKNLVNASKDLGRGPIYTFFMVVVPWTKTALISGIVLVLLPALTTVAVPSFLNNANNGSLIGDVIANQGANGLNNKISLARTSVLALVVSAVMFGLYALFVWVPKWISGIKRRLSK